MNNQKDVQISVKKLLFVTKNIAAEMPNGPEKKEFLLIMKGYCDHGHLQQGKSQRVMNLAKAIIADMGKEDEYVMYLQNDENNLGNKKTQQVRKYRQQQSNAQQVGKRAGYYGDYDYGYGWSYPWSSYWGWGGSYYGAYWSYPGYWNYWYPTWSSYYWWPYGYVGQKKAGMQHYNVSQNGMQKILGGFKEFHARCDDETDTCTVSVTMDREGVIELLGNMD